jgi:FkbM family methyltransferase
MQTDTKIGFIITYFHNSDEGLNLLKENLKILSREDWYLVLASHSPLDVEVQKMADFYFFQSKNVVDDRKYSHGVAESNLIEISLKHLRDIGVSWTYKASYDIEINDISQFKKWIIPNKKFVSCIWGNNILCTNSFFANIDFILQNINFYRTVDEMFVVNNVLENCWEHDIKTKNLTNELFSFENKEVFYGVNKIDKLFYDYNQIQFWYSPEELKFYIKNTSDRITNAHIRIFDYWTDLCIYLNRDFSLIKDITFWVSPPFNNNLKFSKNGFYLEVYLEDRTIVKNVLIKDFDWKHSFSKKFKLIKNTEVKFNEFSDFNDLNIYKNFGIDVNDLSNYVDIGANYGMASFALIGEGIKTYMVEADPNNVEKLKKMWSNNSSIKIIDLAITSNEGTIDFWVTEGIGSVVSSIYHDDANGNSENRKKITVQSISPNTLIEKWIEEDTIDLMKIDIEGAEYDLFESITDENLCKIKRIILEFHLNENYRVMNIIKKLTINGFRFKLSKWSSGCGDYIVENKMGVIYAWK